MWLQQLAAALEKQEVTYCFVGGVAVNLHGIPRMTYDADLVVETSRTNLLALKACLEALGLRSRLPLDIADFADDIYRDKLASERNLIALSFVDPNQPLREVDVLVSPPVNPSHILDNRELLHVESTPVWVASIPDMVMMKQKAGRQQDLADIEHLRRIQGLPSKDLRLGDDATGEDSDG